MADLIRIEMRDCTLTLCGELPALPPGATQKDRARVDLKSVSELAEVFAMSAPDGPLARVDADALPLIYEQSEYDLYVEGPRDVLVRSEVEGLVREVRPRVAAALPFRHYRLNLRNDVGVLRLLLEERGRPLARLDVDVFPRKLDYHRDYLAIVDDITAIAHNLVFDVMPRTMFRVDPREATGTTTTEWYRILEGIAGELFQTIDAIDRAPSRTLGRNWEMQRIDRVRRIEERLIERTARVAGASGRATKAVGMLPPWCVAERLPARVFRVDFDTPANRATRSLLENVHGRLRLIRSDLLAAGISVDAPERKQAAHWLGLVSALIPKVGKRLQYEWVEGARPQQTGGSSANVESHPLYSKVMSLGRLLLRGLHVSTLGSYTIGSKPIWLLYEYWCFLAIVDLLRSHSMMVQNSAVQVDHQGSRVQLAKGEEAAVEFVHRATGRPYRVVYNRLYPTPTTWQRPDAAVHLESDTSIFVFDAKYRIQFDAEYTRTYGGVGPHVEDVNTMHRYRDAIVNPALATHPRLVRSACVLFPMVDEGAYRDHRFFRSLADVGIGGLPFLPANRSYVARRLNTILEGALDA